MALDAAARLTSDSLIVPTPPWMTFTTTSSFDNLTRLCFTASTEPCTSALYDQWKFLYISCLDLENRSSRDNFAFVSSINLFLLSEIKVSAKLLASFSFGVATNTSPAFGTSFNPEFPPEWTGRLLFTRRPLSSIIARTFRSRLLRRSDLPHAACPSVQGQ